ncbi:hypothetical protein M2101_001331 [Parabacteroides sp. PM5-20]|nr:hypothetical protein [Parabacteroides sp. PM5-20]
MSTQVLTIVDTIADIYRHKCRHISAILLSSVFLFRGKGPLPLQEGVNRIKKEKLRICRKKNVIL